MYEYIKLNNKKHKLKQLKRRKKSTKSKQEKSTTSALEIEEFFRIYISRTFALNLNRFASCLLFIFILNHYLA